jgi:hypothetical protein
MPDMTHSQNNHAYIDGTNLHLSAKNLGWEIDWSKFREYLQKRHNVNQAYYCIGYMHENEPLYDYLINCNYIGVGWI